MAILVGSLTSDNDTVERVGVAPPKKSWLSSMTKPEFPDAVEETTATLDTVAGAGADVRVELPLSLR